MCVVTHVLPVEYQRQVYRKLTVSGDLCRNLLWQWLEGKDVANRCLEFVCLPFCGFRIALKAFFSLPPVLFTWGFHFTLPVLLLPWCFTPTETIRLIRDGQRWGKKHTTYTYRYTHHQKDSCIKMGGDESHFNFSLIVKDKVTRRCPQTTNFEEKGEPKRNRAEALLLTRLTPYR